jgi:hypothetical protein
MRCITGKIEDNRILVKVGIRVADPEPSEFSGLIYHEFTALVDTGAKRTAISQNVIDRVGLVNRGKILVGNVKRTEEHHTYLFHVGIWPETNDGVPPAVFGIGDEIMGIDGGDSRHWNVLLGMDIITRGALRLERDGSFELAFPG